jgi:UDP-3-O-acyl-N-acetylglucosamine deacetylase
MRLTSQLKQRTKNCTSWDFNFRLIPEVLRFEGEFVRHKVLDAIGDLALNCLLTNYPGH